jgi:hypothetical protein
MKYACPESRRWERRRRYSNEVVSQSVSQSARIAWPDRRSVWRRKKLIVFTDRKVNQTPKLILGCQREKEGGTL